MGFDLLEACEVVEMKGAVIGVVLSVGESQPNGCDAERNREESEREIEELEERRRRRFRHWS